MKDFSFFFLKNFMGSKMGRGFRNTCNDDQSTSTLNQKQQPPSHGCTSSSSCIENDHNTLNAPPRKSVTLEEMILQLELEEAKARKEKASNNGYTEEIMDYFPRRMSCVNNSDILRSARNALDQYPRFSLDGRDAMYRSSFRRNNNNNNNNNIMASRAIDGLKLGRMLHLPHSVGGESVIWCKPGVVPKLMGLEAMPLPISKLCNTKKSFSKDSNAKLSNNALRMNHNLRRREKIELERRQQQLRHAMNSNVCCGDFKRFERGGGGRGRGGGGGGHCSSSNGYCVMKPAVAVEPVYGLGRPIISRRPSSYSYT